MIFENCIHNGMFFGRSMQFSTLLGFCYILFSAFDFGHNVALTLRMNMAVHRLAILH